MTVKTQSYLFRVPIILIMIVFLDLINLLLLKEKDKCYLDFNNVKFGNINSISVVYMIIRSLNANRYKNGEFLNSVEGLPDVICVYETWLTSMRPFIGKFDGYEFVNTIFNSNQSRGVAFL